MNTRYEAARRHILDSGQTLIAAKGFVGVGLSEILLAAGIPKGSFYHYFSSKEGFGTALLEQYVADYLSALDAVLGADGTPAGERLMRYWRRWAETQATSSVEDKCLVVKLSAEVADLSPEMREVLRRGTDRVIARLAACIEEGQHDGSIGATTAPTALAHLLYPLWLGASLLTKLRQDRSAFDEALGATAALLALKP